MNLDKMSEKIDSEKNANQAKVSQSFFKTGKGEYGCGDVFYGIRVPILRKIAREFKELGLDDLEILLDDEVHEKRMVALFILIIQYNSGDDEFRKKVYDIYLKNIKSNINNWDLVDVTSPNIVGDFLLDKDRDVLYDLVVSDDLWERRVAIISTFRFIRENQFEDCLKISEILLEDSHDLIHKAVGWMLREVGKRDMEAEEVFLKKHAKKMPRTMMRYAIERFPEDLRQDYLKGRVS